MIRSGAAARASRGTTPGTPHGLRNPGPDPLVLRLRQDIQGLLDRQLEQGPPAEWNCPA